VGRKALKRKLGKKVLSGRITVTEARARLGRKEAQREARKTQGAYSSALDEVRAMRRDYAMKGTFLGDLPADLSDAEREYAAVIARTRQQQAMLVKSASKQAVPPAHPGSRW
jgi:hypothetical protein